MAYRSEDEWFMAAALKLARRGIGKTSPNPPVGCVLAKDGRLIAGDYHHKTGLLHAEALVLGKVGDSAPGGTLYVTLEPCCFYGRTPACTKAIIEAGISRVVVGAKDPNPKVNGRGIKILLDAGIEVISGIMKSECDRLIRHYEKFITTGMPYIILKYAQSLDGRIATKSGSSKWISSPESLKFAHGLRAQCDDILVGDATANKDNPQLTVRHVNGKNPVRIILTSSGKLKKTLHVFHDGQARTIVATGADLKSPSGAEVLHLPLRNGLVDLKSLIKKLGQMEITSLLVEGGSATLTGFLRQQIADKIIIVVAPMILGEGISALGELNIRTIARAIRFKNLEMSHLGPDCVISGELP